MRVLVATRKGLFVYKDGVVEQTHFLGDRLSLAVEDPRDGAWYAALDHGHFGVKLHRSDDHGASWSEIATPVFPDKPAGDDDKVPWDLKLIWALTPGGEDQSERLWCGTIPGGLFRSDDRGQSWSLVRSLWDDPRRRQWFGGGADHPGIHSICVDPRDSKRVVVGVSCGGVWKTASDGESWALCADGMRAEYMPPDQAGDPVTQDPHCVVQCQASPEVFWAQHHNGIFKSNDGCNTWKEIQGVEPSAFGFPVAVDPSDPQVAYFVPAIKDEQRYPADGRVVVNKTSDGGKTFVSITSGLPQEHAYDLVYRHALDISGNGKILSFGSTTGSLWHSSDGGAHWTTLSHNLPPIYSVSFTKRG